MSIVSAVNIVEYTEKPVEKDDSQGLFLIIFLFESKTCCYYNYLSISYLA